MRLLFSFVGGMGHFLPLRAVAHAAQAAGHTVAFGCGAGMAPAVREAGFEVFVLGERKAKKPSAKWLPLLAVDQAREEEAFRDKFARREAQARAPLMIELCRGWAPDGVVCDEADYGAMAAAERLGLPYAMVLVLAAGRLSRREVVAEAWAELRAMMGLPPDGELNPLSRRLVLSPFPPALRDPEQPLPQAAFSYCPAQPAQAAERPAWLASMPERPLVYFTLGTIFNVESGDLFGRVLAGLRHLPVNVVLTTGREVEAWELGAQPAHVHVAQFLPQEELLPHCSAVVSHGGSGSVAGALLHGLPSVLVAMGADQPDNAARCVALGVARALDPVAATPAMVSEALQAVLSDARYAAAARQVQAEYVQLPGLDAVVRQLEALAPGGARA